MKSTNTDSAKKVAQILLDIGSVLFSRNKPFKFDSGILSPVYVDNRLLISYPKERNEIQKYFLEKIKNEIGTPDVIAGTATAGIPHAAWIAQELNLPLVYVRSKPKDHGRNNQVEGAIKRGQKVIIVEDLISTGGSSINVADALKKLGAKVVCVLAIYSHGLKESEANFKKAKIPLYFLTTTSMVATVAKDNGFLNDTQIASILTWVQNPKGWKEKG